MKRENGITARCLDSDGLMLAGLGQCARSQVFSKQDTRHAWAQIKKREISFFESPVRDSNEERFHVAICPGEHEKMKYLQLLYDGGP